MALKTVAVVLARNEQNHLPETLKILNGFRRSGLLHSVIVVDDASTDRTAGIAKRAGAVVVKNPENLGKRGGFFAGAFAARDLKADVVFVLDADLLRFPEETFKSMVSQIAEKKMLMVIARQFEKVRKPFRGEEGLEKLNNAFFKKVDAQSSNGQRALSIKALEPLFKGNDKWLSLLKPGHSWTWEDRPQILGQNYKLWGLEDSLDRLVPKNRQVLIEKPIFTREAFRRPNSGSGSQYIARHVIEKILDARQKRAMEMKPRFVSNFIKSRRPR